MVEARRSVSVLCRQVQDLSKAYKKNGKIPRHSGVGAYPKQELLHEYEGTLLREQLQELLTLQLARAGTRSSMGS